MADATPVHVDTMRVQRFLRALNRAQVRRAIHRRRELGMTQATLASIAGYSPVTIRFWENGHRIPRPQNRKDWHQALGIEP